MNRKSTKIVIIVILLIAVLTLSIGFATFSTLLTISSDLEVKPDSKYFKINFSSDSNSVVTNDIVPSKSSSTMVATNATIDNENGTNKQPVISGMSAVFTEPGQWVEYSFYSYNSGKYLAYLNEVVFKNVEGKSSPKICTALPGARDDYVQAVCGDIEITVKVGNSTFSSTNTTISGHTLAREKSEPVVVRITYVNNDHWADGDFTVDLGDITLLYQTID